MKMFSSIGACWLIFFLFNSCFVIFNWATSDFKSFDQKQFNIGMFLPIILISVILSQAFKTLKVCVKMFS